MNENYARELLELHTVGVNGGYTQQDVEQLARVFTGWTIEGAFSGRRFGERRGQGMQQARGRGRAGLRSRSGAGQAQRGRGASGGSDARMRGGRGSGEFAFVDDAHQPGAKTVLGKRFPERGVDEGVAAIRFLCSLESTSQFVATKLVRHFVADDPPAGAVSRLARVFRDTGGDLREVSLALVRMREAWDPAFRKFRSPQEWLLAILRLAGADHFPEPAMHALRQLRHAPWAPQAPNGYGDRLSDWGDSASLMSRAELARTLASYPLGREFSLARVRELLVSSPEPSAEALLSLLEDESIRRSERIALALASPTFQWR